MSEKYSVHDYTVEQILNFIKSNEIAIPEIQRPFVWKGKQVRDLVDSLYKGYPTGYIIVSKSPDLKLKDGTTAVGKKIMIDGQQRVTAMMTAFSGLEVFNADFAKSDYASKLKWLKDDNEDIYDPDYSDMLRVAFMSQYSYYNNGRCSSYLPKTVFD